MGDVLKVLIYLIILCCVVTVQPQSGYRSGPGGREEILLPQGYGIELLYSKGTSGIYNNVSNISSMNPASIYKLENLSLGFSYQFQTNLDNAWLAGIGTSRVQNYIPQSLGSVIHYENLSFGIGFSQEYNGSLDIGPIPITTVTEPEGTGDYYYPEFENTIQSYTLSVAYQFKDAFTENTNLSFGLKYLLNNFHSHESISLVTASASALGSNFELGAHYQIKINDLQNINFGTTYTFSTRITDQVQYEGNYLINRDSIPGSIQGGYQIATEPFTIMVNVPSELNFDFYFKSSEKLELLGRVNNIFWHNVSQNTKDQLELSTSAVYSFNPSTNVSLGLFYTDKEYVEDYFNISDELYAVYFTAGVSFQINFLEVDLAVADSHLFSGDYWEQTIGKIGLGIQL